MLIDVVILYVLQGCFRQSVTVVTMYASLGEDAVAHSLNEVMCYTSCACDALTKKSSGEHMIASRQGLLGVQHFFGGYVCVVFLKNKNKNNFF